MKGCCVVFHTRRVPVLPTLYNPSWHLTAGCSHHRFEFQKCRQNFIRSHNERLSVITVCIDNPDCAAPAIQHGHAAPTPSGFAEIVSDDFPVADRALSPFTWQRQEVINLQPCRASCSRHCTRRQFRRFSLFRSQADSNTRTR